LQPIRDYGTIWLQTGPFDFEVNLPTMAQSILGLSRRGFELK
jgi:hypothetical protein